MTAQKPYTIPAWRGGLSSEQRSPRPSIVNATARPIHQQMRQVPAANRRYGPVFGETWVAGDPDVVREKDGFLYLRGVLGLGEFDAITVVEIAGNTFTPGNPEGSPDYRGDWASGGTWTGPTALPYAATTGEIYRFNGLYYVVKTAFIVTAITGQNTPSGELYRSNFGRVYAGTSVNTYRGSSAQGVDPLMVELLGGSYTETLRGTWYGTPYALAYVTAKLPVGEFTEGWPAIRAYVRGWRCFDPRSGGVAFTRNPALHLAAAIASPLIGYGKPTNAITVALAADRCDQMFPDGPRIECNLAIEGAPVPTQQWIETLRGYAGVLLDYREGEYHFAVDGPRATDWRITFGDHTSDVEMVDLPDIEFVPASTRVNVVRVLWTDTSVTPWREVAHLEESEAVQNQTEVPVSQDFRMPGILTLPPAVRFAKERLAEFQLETWRATVTVADEGEAVQAGHVVDLTAPNGLRDDKARVLGKQPIDVGRWQLRVREYNAAAYQEP
jgi:hypothetical protein